MADYNSAPQRKRLKFAALLQLFSALSNSSFDSFAVNFQLCSMAELGGEQAAVRSIPTDDTPLASAFDVVRFQQVVLVSEDDRVLDS